MSPSATRHIALVFDPERLEPRWRQVVAGVRRYAEHVGNWRCTLLQPVVARSLPPGFHGILAPGSGAVANVAAERAIPYVAVSHRGEQKLRLARVVAHRWRAGTLAARHLIDRGYRRLAHLGPTSFQTTGLQWRGYRYVADRWAPGWTTFVFPEARVRLTHRARRGLHNALSQWLDEIEPPVGIFAARDHLARTLAQLCIDKGIRVPEDVGLVGAGNDPDLCPWPPPALTSIEFHFPAVGYRAAALLDRLIDGAPRPGRPIRIVPDLVARRSTDRRLDEHPLVSAALAHIAAHCHRPLHPRDVARDLGVAYRTLQRRFRRFRRRTIAQELALARLARARDLLRSTDLSIDEVARRAGFGTRCHMTSLFQKHGGTTPTAYRHATRTRDA